MASMAQKVTLNKRLGQTLTTNWTLNVASNGYVADAEIYQNNLTDMPNSLGKKLQMRI